MSDVTIGLMRDGEIDAVHALLSSSSLPVEGLDGHLETVLVARRGDRLLGIVALELYADGALLRSLAVAESERGRGLGVDLTHAVIELARSRGVRTLFLLTETAMEFFPRFGFTNVMRADVPDGVRSSIEFTTVCPDSATVQALSLERKTPANRGS